MLTDGKGPLNDYSPINSTFTKTLVSCVQTPWVSGSLLYICTVHLLDQSLYS